MEKLPNDKLAVHVRLPRDVIDKVDEHARRQIVARGDAPTPRSIGVVRRATIADLVDRHLSFGALHPTRVKIVAPMMAIGDIRMMEDGQEAWNEAVEWMDREEQRLTAEAPDVVQAALQLNGMMRRRRSS